METFNKNIKQISEEITNLVISKQRDYGTKNIINSPFGAEHGIIVRLYDKISRIVNLNKTGNEAKKESLEDSWIDVAGYALIALMVRRGKFEAPLDNKQ